MHLPWITADLHRLASMGPVTPHALLLHGQGGVGKRVLARALSRALLCESGREARRIAGGCGECSACLWFDQGSHPDFRTVTSEALAVAAGAELADDEGAGDEPASARVKRAPSKEIKVDQVRALHALMSVATHRGRSRVVMLHPLEAVNEVAANALLKMLEEPPPQTIFVLVSDRLGRIPATIVSRCQRVFVAMPPARVVVPWLAGRGIAEPDALLALAGGAPLTALATSDDAEGTAAHRAFIACLSRPGVETALATAESFGRSPPAPLIHWMQQWLADCIASRLAGRIRYHPAHSGVIVPLAGAARLDALMSLMQRLASIRRTIDHPLNTRLLLEGLLLAYAEAMRPVTA